MNATPPVLESKVLASIGDHVLLHLNGTTPTQAPVKTNSDQPLAATVAYVWGPAMVNLNVIDHNGNSHALTSVTFNQPGTDAPASGMYCELDCILGTLVEGESFVPGMDFSAGAVVTIDTDPPLSFGDRAVGLSFNPSQDPAVKACKTRYAALIDQLEARRQSTTDGEVKRLCSIAITEAQTAQMWAVKALTWAS